MYPAPLRSAGQEQQQPPPPPPSMYARPVYWINVSRAVQFFFLFDPVRYREGRMTRTAIGVTGISGRTYMADVRTIGRTCIVFPCGRARGGQCSDVFPKAESTSSPVQRNPSQPACSGVLLGMKHVFHRILSDHYIKPGVGRHPAADYG